MRLKPSLFNLHDMEIWKDIIGFEYQYQISDFGRLRSKPRIVIRSNGAKQTVKGKVLKTFIGSTGYEFGVFQIGKKTKNFAIHRLVAIHFIPNPYKKYAVNHLNGLKTDNRLENLEWVTKSENEIHARKTGLKCTKGEKASKAILTESQVMIIRAELSVFTQRQLAQKYGVSRSCIASIAKGRTWTHI